MWLNGSPVTFSPVGFPAPAPAPTTTPFQQWFRSGMNDVRWTGCQLTPTYGGTVEDEPYPTWWEMANLYVSVKS